MLLHRLCSVATLSLALALAGCGGMDDTLSPHIKPDGGSNGGSNNGGDTGGSNNGGSNGGSNNGGSNGGSNNGGSDNGGGDNSTNPPVANCPLPDNSYPLPILGNTDELATYELAAYSKANSASSLAGTWVLIANTSAQTPAQSSRSAQKYLFVITSSGNDYQVANCSGQILSTKTYTCVDRGGKEIGCDEEGAVRLEPPIISYQPWQAQIDAKIETKDSKQIIHLPLFDADFGHPEQGIKLELIGSDFNELKSTDAVYQAIKISDNTNALGTSAVFGSPASPVWCTVQVKAESNSCSSSPSLRLISVFATTEADQHKLLTGEGATALQLSKIFADASKGDGRSSNDYAGSIESSAITTDSTQVKLSFSIDQSGTTRSINLDVDASASR